MLCEIVGVDEMAESLEGVDVFASRKISSQIFASFLFGTLNSSLHDASRLRLLSEVDEASVRNEDRTRGSILAFINYGINRPVGDYRHISAAMREVIGANVQWRKKQLSIFENQVVSGRGSAKRMGRT